MKDKVEAINKETGLGFKTDQFTPLISWTPSSIHQEKDPRYDLYCFSYRILSTDGTFTMQQPWIAEASRMNPYTYKVTLNRMTASKRDSVKVISSKLRPLRDAKLPGGRLKTMEGQHPQVIGIATCGGH
jgi:hypothetical protein